MVIKANKWLVGLVSAALVSGAASLEGTRLMPYYDTGGIPTVCTGHTGADVRMGMQWTPQACREVLEKDLVQHSEGILNCTTVPLKENQYDAFTLFAYNVGVGAFCRSTAHRLLNEGKYTEACNELYKWVYINGKYSVGLYNRRKEEVALCLSQK